MNEQGVRESQVILALPVYIDNQGLYTGCYGGSRNDFSRIVRKMCNSGELIQYQ